METEVLTNKGEIHLSIIASDKEGLKDVLVGEDFKCFRGTRRTKNAFTKSAKVEKYSMYDFVSEILSFSQSFVNYLLSSPILHTISET